MKVVIATVVVEVDEQSKYWVEDERAVSLIYQYQPVCH